MKISDLKEGMNNVNLQAKIAELEAPREVVTKFGSTTFLTVATLVDESGTIKLTLWGDASKGVEKGKTVKVSGGFVKSFRDELQLSIGRGGAVKVI